MKFIYRGFMLDTARKFFPVYSIFKILDFMNEAKLNVLHRSFTNNESFSLNTKFDNGLLSKDNVNSYNINDIKNVISYAYKYKITIIPEFDFPGHVGAWNKIYHHLMVDWTTDEFNMTNPYVYKYLTKLFNEIIPVFWDYDPVCKFIHMGHDEISSPKDYILPSLSYAYKIANTYNKTPIIWNDPITSKNIKQNEIIQHYTLTKKRYPKYWDHWNCLNMNKDELFIIQVWDSMKSLNYILSLNYKTIISVSKYWYIGGESSPSNFIFPINDNIIGAELCWFTSESDDPNDLEWIHKLILEAGNKLSNY